MQQPTECFVIDGAKLEVPLSAMNPRLRGRLGDGGFERHERGLLRSHLRSGDRVLDVGAGIGMVAITAARIVGPAAVTAVEANPDLIPFLRRNLRRNLGPGVTVINAAVVPPGRDAKFIELHVGQGFWSASVLPERARFAQQSHRVKARPLNRLVRRAEPTVLSMDIEGAELEILARPLDPAIRLVVIELHPALYGAEGRAIILQRMASQGFVPCDDRDTEEVVALRRGD